MRIVERAYDEADRQALLRAGVHPVLARVYAGRRVHSADELSDDTAKLLAPEMLANVGPRRHAARRYDRRETAHPDRRRLRRGRRHRLRGRPARIAQPRRDVDYLVPDRFKLGYGLSPELVDLAAARVPDLLVTVDNGIASVDGVARANALGLATLITDHHLPGDQLPAATCIVNPNQPGCSFPSKSLAGVGVMFYVMLALRAELRARGAFRDAAGAESRRTHGSGRARYDRRRRAARCQQPGARRAGPEASARRACEAGLNALLRVAGRAPAQGRLPSISASCSGRD